MDDASVFGAAIAVTSIALLGGIAVNLVGSRIRVPAPALFLLIAAAASNLVPALGTLPLVVDEHLVTVALIVILFDGGMHIGWSRFRDAAGAITWVGLAGTALTAGAVAAVANLVLGIPWPAALLLGAALAPTDPAVVFAVLGRREVDGRSGTILEGESGFNDPVGIALLGVLLAVVAGGTADLGGAVAEGAVEFGLQMVVGVGVGAVGGLVLRWMQRRLPLPNEALHPIRTIAFAALVYGAATLVHGSGYLAVFLAGILVGDNRAPFQGEVRRFTAGLASLAEIIAFVVLGLSVDWRDVLRPEVLVPGVVLAAVLALVIRPVLVGALLLPVRLQWGERAFVLAAGLKGAVPILLGLSIRAADVPGADRIAAIIFVVVVLSVLVQGGLVPQLARWFRVPMRDVEQQPFLAGLRVTEEPQDLRRFVVGIGSPADGATVEGLSLGDGGWISLVRRDGAAVPLRGTTRLRRGDEVLAFGDPALDLEDLFRAPPAPA